MVKKVLIVEDDKDFQDIYSLYLQGESFEVQKAYNGSEGLAILDKEIPDLIILDLIMPVMDGEEFYVHLREREPCRSIPVIIASVNEKMPQRIEELGGVAGILRKPFEIDKLLQAVRTHLK
ncbi:MAG TPA: response regulator [Candidatus Omnitrophota bacterium]|nr:response regulator [Candidatus Omnitrophota bacterium]